MNTITKSRDAYIGARVERIEDLRLLTGKGRYVDDVHREGMLHAAIVRSSVAHGLIKTIDTAEAGALPGVHAIHTGRDVAAACNGKVPTIPLRLAAMPELAPFEQFVIALDKVRYVGEPVAIVIAETAGEAEDAADRVFVDIEPLPPVPNAQAAARGESLLFPACGSNAAITYVARKGDARNATGPYVRKESFGVQRHSAVTLEARGLVAEWDETRRKMTVFGAAKVPFTTRRMLGAMLDLPLECIDMIELDVGGGFGVRGEFYVEDFLVPFAALQSKRPVKWVEDRRENLLGSNHSREMDAEVEIVCERNGRVLAIRGTVAVDCGAYMRTSAAVPPRNVAQFMSGPYDIADIHVESTVYLTNKAPIGTYRGPGRFETDFFRERLFDMAARDLGIDPVEFRRINLVKPEQMPYPLATIDKPDKPEELDSGDYEITLDRCLEEFGWKEKLALQGRLIDGKYHGIAVGCFVEGGAAGPKETARIEIEEDGSITVYVGSTAVGQGLVTVLTQIAADALDLPMDRIRVLHGSTPYLKEGYGSYHSRSTVMGGSAVLNAATKLMERIRAAAATECRGAADEVEIGPGLTATFRDQTLTAADLGKMKVQADGEFSNHHHTYAYGAAAAQVTVDPGTGRVELVDYFNVEDIGRIINPLTAQGQAVGAVVQGLGGTFLEHLAYDDDGQFLAGTLADYLLPSAEDFPCIRALVLENSPAPHNPLGAKGGGEGGIVPVGGVVANAVAAALSSLEVEPKTLPLTPPKIWALIRDGSRKQRTFKENHMNSPETAPQRASNARGNVPITLACALYDRMQALHTGEVKPEGIDLTFRVEDFPRKLFDHAMGTQEFDVCEMSSSDYITRVSKGDCPFVALPVFPSKMFRHGMIAINQRSGIRTPKDLEGKRVGVMRYTMTAAVWQRGHLQNDYGLDLSKIHWVEGSINSPGSHGVPTIIPPGTSFERNESGKSMSDLLAAGNVDATIGTHLPNSRFTHPDVVRLFPDFKEVEKAYYKRTGIFPIMHLIAIKREVYEKHPFIAESLYRACCESKQAALTKMRNYSALRCMLPWMPEELDELDRVFGSDPWKYGLEEARTNLGTLMTYMVQQRMLKETIPVEKLFVSVSEA